jgi:hypothetical protein
MSHINDTVADIMMIRSKVREQLLKEGGWPNSQGEAVIAQYTLAVVQMQLVDVMQRTKDGV